MHRPHKIDLLQEKLESLDESLRGKETRPSLRGNKRALLIACVLAAFLANVAAGAAATVSEQVESVLNAQRDAWNAGDLGKFMEGYLKSPDTSYTAGGKDVWGYDAIEKRYQDKYGSSKETMGKLSFSDLKVFKLGPEAALAIGHWHLTDAPGAPCGGTFSLVLKHAGNHWKIFHDHTSVAKVTNR